MNKEEIDKIFDFLENEMNKLNEFYFKMDNCGYINAYIKGDNKSFAQFYPQQILKFLKNEKVNLTLEQLTGVDNDNN